MQRTKAYSHFHIFVSVLFECLRGNELEHKLRVFLYNVRMTWKSSKPHQLQFGTSIGLFPYQNTCLLSCTSVASVATCTRISACLAGCLSIHSSIHVILCVCVVIYIIYLYLLSVFCVPEFWYSENSCWVFAPPSPQHLDRLPHGNKRNIT